ncbi:MAG: 16S rRNA (guanine(527)-N(7))-methyltransferase RsmG [Terriglobales bacterium]
MKPARIAALLSPFLPAPLAEGQLCAIAAYLDILLRWNARMNLTAVRDPEHIVTRHFGESLFAAAQLLEPPSSLRAIDVGSGAGFPGLPLKIYAPALRLTLIESQNKKVTFLREIVRTLALREVEVFGGRAEDYLAVKRGTAFRAEEEEAAADSSGIADRARADLVTLRAVESFESVLPIAASLLRRSTDLPSPASPGAARLALLIGATQAPRARDLLRMLSWDSTIPIPQSSARVLLIGRVVSR